MMKTVHKPRRQKNKYCQNNHSLWSEFKLATRTYWEYMRGAYKYRKLGPSVTVFGSARFRQEDSYYKLAMDMGKRLAEANLITFTGGGPGIMSAVHQGASQAGGYCVGANIKIPLEEEPNPHMHLAHFFRYFFVRKVMLTKYACGFVVFPGGFGTLDELFEIATLMQTQKIQKLPPIILISSEYWQPLYDFICKTMLKKGTIGSKDVDLFRIVDDPEAAMQILLLHFEHGQYDEK